MSATTARDRFPVAVIFNACPAEAARIKINAFRAIDDSLSNS
jgi:hypothetical protein